MVGATAAYAIAMQEIASEIVIVDIAEQLAWGQAADIADGLDYTDGVKVRTGSYDEIANDDIVVITSGAPQKPGQTRLELLGVNANIMKEVVGKVMQGGATPYIFVVANPVDALTYIALKESGLPKNRVFGSGTTLDTFRLRVELATKLGVANGEVDAYVLGEHGDSSFSAIAGAQVGNIRLSNFPGFEPHMTENIDTLIQERAYKVIDAKKSTYYAIGQVVAQVVKALQANAISIFPLCSLAEGEYGLQDVVLGLPSAISSKGVRILEGYELNDQERQSLERSAEIVKHAISTVQENN